MGVVLLAVAVVTGGLFLSVAGAANQLPATLSAVGSAFASGLGSALGPGLTRLFDEGAVQATAVADLASAQHVSLHDVTTESLQAHYPSERWLPATTPAGDPNRPYPEVSVATDAGVVLVATVTPAGCSFGAYVVDTSDPAAVADGLTATGSYVLQVPSTSTRPPVACVATAALVRGWSPMSVSDSMLRDANESRAAANLP